MTGSVTPVEELIRVGQLDRLRLVTDPVVLGVGTRLFDSGRPSAFQLVEVHAFATGAVSATYDLVRRRR